MTYYDDLELALLDSIVHHCVACALGQPMTEPRGSSLLEAVRLTDIGSVHTAMAALEPAGHLGRREDDILGDVYDILDALREEVGVMSTVRYALANLTRWLLSAD
jgi:hypothetical protein